MNKLSTRAMKKSFAPTLKASTSIVAIISAVGIASVAQAQTVTLSDDPAVLNNMVTIDGGNIIGADGVIGAPGVVVIGQADGTTLDITNSGVIQGRGNAAAGLSAAGDGIRLERDRVEGSLANPSTAIFTGTVTNSGLIASEGANGTVAGFRTVNGTSFQGTLTNSGTITGIQNGVYFGNATEAGGGVNSGTVNNLAGGTISSASRAFNIDGSGLTINNAGQIIATASQRNGTVYADSTAQDFTLNNLASGLIDAGAGLEGAGFSVELSEAGNAFVIDNAGIIQGRGQASAGATQAGDGLRFERTRVEGALDGTTTGLFTGSIVNSGLIDSESTQGTAAGIRFVNGTSFQGTLDNSGTISGAQNGLYFGNATPAGGGINSGTVNNLATGVISSNSRAVNIDGSGLTLNNAGTIVATASQRNGTVYADATAQDFTLNNLAGGLIDAGADLESAAFSVELSEAGNNFTINNAGTIQGRGQAGAGATQAGDGLRFERTRVAGALDGTTTGLFTGSIVNSGLIDSESTQGTAAGIRFVNGTSFQGTIDNSGTISGVQNGLYFGNPTPAGGGVNSGTVNNLAGGVISSDSRAVNIDGTGLTLNNAGSILGTGNQRNGTVYADGTADNYTINNLAGGLIDAGVGNQGSGISLQSGSIDGDIRTISISNAGNIVGRGAALPSGETAGLRIFNGAGAETSVTVNGDITNSGTISSETSAAVLIENVNFTGTFTNTGTLTGVSAFDASSAQGAVNFIQNGGALQGDFIGSSALDTLSFASGSSILAGSVLGNVSTIVADFATVSISGNQTLSGDFASNGVLNFELGQDSLAVDGNTSFGESSIVNVATPDDITTLTLGAPISVISETGTFTDNGLTVNVLDDDFLVDYNVILGSVSVTPTAVNLANVSDDTNISNFGGALTTAFVAGALQADVANSLNDVADATAFDAVASALLPTINEGITREIFETNSQANSFIDRRLQGEKTGAWVQALYRTADRDAESASVSGYDADSFGFTFGLDTKLSETLTAGVAFNYASIDVDEDGGANDRTDIDSYQITAYAGLDNDDFFANAQVGYTFADVDSTRTSSVGTVSSNSDVDGFSAIATVGKEYVNGGIAFTPLASVHFANLSQDDFSEVGGLNFDVDADSVSYLDLKAGFELSTVQNNTDGFNARPLFRASYVYDAIGDARVLNASFAGAAAPVLLSSDDPAQSRFELGAGLEATNGTGITFSVEYEGEFASNYTSHGGFLRARVGF